jgi:hypothetical protein
VGSPCPFFATSDEVCNTGMTIYLCGPANVRRRCSAFPRCWLAMLCFAFVFGRNCGLPPPSLFGPDPSNPYAAVPPVSYRSVIAPYESLRPVEPGDWVKQNEQVAPKAEAPAHHH